MQYVLAVVLSVALVGVMIASIVRQDHLSARKQREAAAAELARYAAEVEMARKAPRPERSRELPFLVLQEGTQFQRIYLQIPGQQYYRWSRDGWVLVSEEYCGVCGGFESHLCSQCMGDGHIPQVLDPI